MLHTKSWHSTVVSLRPAAPVNRSTANLCSRCNGAGPEARPPNVLRMEPSGRTALVSNGRTVPARGTCVATKGFDEITHNFGDLTHQSTN